MKRAGSTGRKEKLKLRLKSNVTHDTHLCESHPGDDGQHYLLPFCGVGVLLVLLQPGFQGAGGFSGGIFTA